MNGVALTTDEFIRRSKIAHGDRFDYTETVYTTSRKKVKIICKEHGEFFQSPYDHFVYPGCYICGNSGRGKITSDIFMVMINNLYEDIDYNKIEYKSYDEKVEFVCTIHDYSYWQTPKAHVHYSKGCPKCSMDQRILTRTGGRQKDAYTQYCNDVRNITRRTYKKYKNIINPLDLKRGLGKGMWTLDHIFSTSDGFKNNIVPEIVGHWTNLRMLEFVENSKKNHRSDKTMKQLLEDYKKGSDS